MRTVLLNARLGLPFSPPKGAVFSLPSYLTFENNAAFNNLNKYGWIGARYMGKSYFVLTTTLIIVFLPLITEISREPEVINAEKAQVKDLRAQGYSDVQLQQMGFSESTLYGPAVLDAK